MTYQIERAPHARALIELAVNMGRVMMPTSKLQAFAIRTGFRAIGLVPRLQEYFSQMKYKPKPFFREGLVVPNDGGLKMAGRLLPQPHVELPHRNRKMLDELLATRFCLVAYGADAQRVAMEALRLDFGLADLPALAILPNIYNPASDCGFDSRIGIARDYTGEFGLSMPSGSNVLLLIRPDRYVIGATVFEPSRAHELAGAVKAMVTRTHTNHPQFTPTASENVTSESAAQ
jgi:3-(3-hydroxy-phenyl)propionate hydroxylase